MPRRWGLSILSALPALEILLGVALLVGGRMTAFDPDGDGG